MGLEPPNLRSVVSLASLSTKKMSKQVFFSFNNERFSKSKSIKAARTGNAVLLTLDDNHKLGENHIGIPWD